MIQPGAKREGFWYWLVRRPAMWVLVGCFLTAIGVWWATGWVWALWADTGFNLGFSAVNIGRIFYWRRRARHAWDELTRWQRNGGRTP